MKYMSEHGVTNLNKNTDGPAMVTEAWPSEAFGT